MKKENNQKKKPLFGRNLFTLIFILVSSILLICIISSTVSYISVGNENDVTPFVTKDNVDITLKMDNVVKMDGKDFTDFNIEFTCTEYNTETKTGKFKLTTYRNDNTEALFIDTKYNGSLCLAADWVGYVKYSSNYTSRNIGTASSKGTTTFTVGLIDFPAKANTWPIPVTVDSPDAYLYLSYTYTNNGQTRDKIVILKYTYTEFNIQSGGIPR